MGFLKVQERGNALFFMYKVLIVLSSLFFCSCGNDAATGTTLKDTVRSSQTIHTNITDTVVTGARPMVLSGCYQMILKRDTASLSLTVKDTTVTGTLRYNF
ncbi:MAG TPA: hypothetical protein VM187_00590, partial [Niastella sp.]|nr:hypothetical protein [Niastella sp.]